MVVPSHDRKTHQITQAKRWTSSAHPFHFVDVPGEEFSNGPLSCFVEIDPALRKVGGGPSELCQRRRHGRVGGKKVGFKKPRLILWETLFVRPCVLKRGVRNPELGRFRRRCSKSNLCHPMPCSFPAGVKRPRRARHIARGSRNQSRESFHLRVWRLPWTRWKGDEGGNK